MNQKDEPRTGYLIHLRSGEDFYIKSIMLLEIVAFNWTIGKFLNTLAVHTEGIRHPTIYAYLTYFFVSVSC
jgi:hypothetical protein